MSMLCVVIGAGAAGLGAGLELRARGIPFLILEARDRIGGRAHTVERAGLSLDLGCEWLHRAENNSWRRRFEANGIPLDPGAPAWSRPALATTFPIEMQEEYRDVLAKLTVRIEAVANKAEDTAVGDLLDPGSRWNPLLNAFSSAYNGAPFPKISAQDYAAYDAGEANWRIPMGYGAAMARVAADLPIRLQSPVQRIEHGGGPLRVIGEFGSLEAFAVVVTVPTTLLAAGAITFDPPLPDKIEAAAALPLGHVLKVFLRLEGPEGEGASERVFTEPLGPTPAGLFLRGGGRPVAELYVGGELAKSFQAAGERASADFAVERLVQAYGSDIRGRVSALAVTDWSHDPWSQGAYSYAAVGCHGARRVLAEPVDGRLFFAGEAAHDSLFSTAHGAHDTGVVAATGVAAMIERA